MKKVFSDFYENFWFLGKPESCSCYYQFRRCNSASQCLARWFVSHFDKSNALNSLWCQSSGILEWFFSFACWRPLSPGYLPHLDTSAHTHTHTHTQSVSFSSSSAFSSCWIKKAVWWLSAIFEGTAGWIGTCSSDIWTQGGTVHIWKAYR